MKKFILALMVVGSLTTADVQAKGPSISPEQMAVIKVRLKTAVKSKNPEVKALVAKFRANIKELRTEGSDKRALTKARLEVCKQIDALLVLENEQFKALVDAANAAAVAK